MKTLTLTQARANLGKLCERARLGEEIGIITGDQIVLLLPVEVKRVVPGEIPLVPMTDGYVSREYGVTPGEFDAFKRKEAARLRRAKHEGRVKTFSGRFIPSTLA